MGGSLREGAGRRLWFMEDLADDGKRFDALDIAGGAGGCYRGGGLREGVGSGSPGVGGLVKNQVGLFGVGTPLA